MRCNVLAFAAQFINLGLIFETTGVVSAAVGLILPNIYLISILGSLLARLSPSTSSPLTSPHPRLPTLPLVAKPPATPQLRPVRAIFSILSVLGLSGSSSERANGADGVITVQQTVDVSESEEEKTGGGEDSGFEEQAKSVRPRWNPPSSPSSPQQDSSFSQTLSMRSTATTASALERLRISPFATTEEVEEAVDAEVQREIEQETTGGGLWGIEEVPRGATAVSWEEAEKTMADLT